MNIVILGPPGTGKGTQAERISKEYQLEHISTGDIFRQLLKDKDSLGVEAYEKYWKDGNLVPDDITIELVKKHLKNKENYILDGFPRTIPQAEALDQFAKIDLVLNIDSSDELIKERLTLRRVCPKCKDVYGKDKQPKEENKCDICQTELIQREDDKPEIIKDRLVVYRTQTKPLINYYKDKIININGNQNIEKVFEDIKEVLNDSN